MAPYDSLKGRKREDYPFHLEYRTRWSDNDMYAHMNNSIYSMLFDSIINTYLMRHCGFVPHRREPQYGMIVHSHTNYFSSVSFPEIAELALRVVHLGRTSVRYEIAIFSQGIPHVRAVGVFVQVFVDRNTDQPNPKVGIHPTLRRGLERILIRLPGDDEDRDSTSTGSGNGTNKGINSGIGVGVGVGVGVGADADGENTTSSNSTALTRRVALSKL